MINYNRNKLIKESDLFLHLYIKYSVRPNKILAIHSIHYEDANFALNEVWPQRSLKVTKGQLYI